MFPFLIDTTLPGMFSQRSFPFGYTYSFYIVLQFSHMRWTISRQKARSKHVEYSSRLPIFRQVANTILNHLLSIKHAPVQFRSYYQKLCIFQQPRVKVSDAYFDIEDVYKPFVYWPKHAHSHTHTHPDAHTQTHARTQAPLRVILRMSGVWIIQYWVAL